MRLRKLKQGPTMVTLDWLIAHHACGRSKMAFIKRFLRGKSKETRGKIGINLERVLAAFDSTAPNGFTSLYDLSSWKGWLLVRLALTAILRNPMIAYDDRSLLPLINDVIKERYSEVPALQERIISELRRHDYCS